MKGSLSPNSTLSHFVILSKLGAGGMGEVYLFLSEQPTVEREFIFPLDFHGARGDLGCFTERGLETGDLKAPNALLNELDYSAVKPGG